MSEEINRKRETNIKDIWNYYLTIEADLANTSKYIEPAGQQDVYSFEFAKIIILATTELESVFKLLCNNGEEEGGAGCIAEYKEIIISKYPGIVNATVTVSRLHRDLQPFHEWLSGRLTFWDAYNKIKHSREAHFSSASYINATYAVAALYVAIYYLAKSWEIDAILSGEYIISEYEPQYLMGRAPKELP